MASLRREDPDHDGEHDGGTVVHRQVAHCRDCREVLEVLGEVLDPGAVGVEVHEATQDAADAQSVDKRRRVHDGDAPAVDEADCRTDEDAHQDRSGNGGAIAQHRAHDSSDDAQVGANGDVNLANEERERHAHGDERVDDRRVEARGDVRRVEERRVYQPDHQEEGDEEQDAAQLPRMQKLLQRFHGDPHLPSVIPAVHSMR